MKRRIFAGLRIPQSLSLAMIATLALLLLTTVSVQANSVTVNDQSNVLDAGKVKAEGGKLSKSLLVYTTNTFSGDQNALDQNTRQQLPDQSWIVIGIDTVQRHLSVESGGSVKLSDSQASDAVSAFKSNINGNDYTGATIAAIDSIKSSLSGGTSSITPLGVAVIVALIGGVLAFIVFAFRRQRRGGPPYGGRRRGLFGLPFFGGYAAGDYYGSQHGTNHGGFGGGGGGSFGGGGGGGGFGGGGGGSF